MASKVTLVCPTCGTSFAASTRDVNRNRKYCSRACSHVARRASVSLICPRCGKSFTVKPFFADKRTYCSYKCLFTRHGASHYGENNGAYRVWKGMRQRCNNPHTIGWKDYGGRGITVCPEWDSFEQFLADMGPRPSKEYSLDRLDNEQGYSKANCRWATTTEQGANRRGNRFLEYDGRRLTLAQWAQETGIPYATLRDRIANGWSPERILTTTPRKPRPKAG